ncbi:hypothetical protein [Cypionkella aquatica]|uniref:hypothetical protein n=1 Tax=Cypionkella aquatica TaxID=1756042 RepID=UPI0024E0A318|nr:hypothetical protein [Cypionkella aquatica]
MYCNAAEDIVVQAIGRAQIFPVFLRYTAQSADFAAVQSKWFSCSHICATLQQVALTPDADLAQVEIKAAKGADQRA